MVSIPQMTPKYEMTNVMWHMNGSYVCESNSLPRTLTWTGCLPKVPNNF